MTIGCAGVAPLIQGESYENRNSWGGNGRCRSALHRTDTDRGTGPGSLHHEMRWKGRRRSSEFTEGGRLLPKMYGYERQQRRRQKEEIEIMERFLFAGFITVLTGPAFAYTTCDLPSPTCSKLAATCAAYNKQMGSPTSRCAEYKTQCMQSGSWQDRNCSRSNVTKK